MRMKEYPNLTSLRLSNYQKEKLQRIAGERTQSISDLIRYIIDIYLDGYLKEKK